MSPARIVPCDTRIARGANENSGRRSRSKTSAQLDSTASTTSERSARERGLESIEGRVPVREMQAIEECCRMVPVSELLASALSPPVQPVGQNRERPPSLPMKTVFERTRAIGAAATSPADLQRAMGVFGWRATPCSAGSGTAAGNGRPQVAAP